MTNSDIKLRNRRRMRIEKTTVVSINGKPFEEVLPNIKNEFNDYVDAFNYVAKHMDTRILSIKTKKIPAMG
jgi:hypothetical protein